MYSTQQQPSEEIYDFQNTEGIEYLKSIEKNSIDLILTDPPYIISKSSGMDAHYNNVKQNEANSSSVKSEEEWEEYKKNKGIVDDKNKDKYLKYGSIYGKKYCVQTDYGDWERDFTIQILEDFIKK